MKRLAILLLLQPSSMAMAMQARDFSGLPVQVEAIAEEVVVDGVALRITRAEGRGVAELAHRIQARWRSEGSEVLEQQVPGWQAVSRLHRGKSELIQWRGTDAAGRLLHSLLATSLPPQRGTPAPFVLPAPCAWGRVIEGRAGDSRFEQRSGRCTVAASQVSGALQSRLQAQDWSVSGQADTGWELERAGALARLTLSEGPGRRQSSLVWISVQPDPGAGR